MITLLEDLPNEILLGIFDYTRLIDLYRAFTHLNQRFNRLIQSLQCLSLRLTQSETDEGTFFAQQIARLVIVTLHPISLQSFPNLRILIINWGNENHLQEIRPEWFPHLIFLSLPLSFNPTATITLASDIFNDRFPALRYADLGKISLPLHSTWTLSSSLRSIKILCTNVNILPLILHVCPQLTHIQVRIQGEDELNLNFLSLMINHPLTHFIFNQSLNTTHVIDITQILSCLPHIKYLDLLVYTRSLIDLLEFIAKNLPDLIHFNCHIIEYSNQSEEIWRDIHPCFRTIQRTVREDSFCLYTNQPINHLKRFV